MLSLAHFAAIEHEVFHVRRLSVVQELSAAAPSLPLKDCHVFVSEWRSLRRLHTLKPGKRADSGELVARLGAWVDNYASQGLQPRCQYALRDSLGARA